MKTIATTLTSVTNEMDVRGNEILRLISLYIPGFVGRYYGFRTLGTHNLSYPAVHVVPDSQIPAMDRTGKYHMKWDYKIWWFVIDNVLSDAVALSTSCAETLIKLFSNNALNDIGSGNSNQFKAHSGFWINSELKSVDISRTYVNATPNTNDKSMCVGVIRFEIEDILKK